MSSLSLDHMPVLRCEAGTQQMHHSAGALLALVHKLGEQQLWLVKPGPNASTSSDIA